MYRRGAISGPGHVRVRLRERRALVAMALVLSIVGILVQWGIVRHRAASMSLLVLHVLTGACGVAVALALSRTRIAWVFPDPRPIIGMFTVMLALVYGAQRLGIESARPPGMFGEVSPDMSAALRLNLTRLLLPIALAHLFTQGIRGMLPVRRFLLGALLSCVWGLFLSPDAGFGPLLSLMFIATVMAWLAGLRTAHVVGFVVYVWLLLLVFVIATGRPHWERLAYVVRERWIPNSDPLHLAHATASIARGGIFGVGPGNASPLTYALPTAESRHVYAVLGQELGLAGCLFVLALFLLILLRGLHVAEAALTTRAQVGAAGVVMTLTLQAFHHIAFNCALSPTVGTPLPFLSAGTPNVLYSWAALGLLLSTSQPIRRHERAMTSATDDAPVVPLWKPLRRRIVQLLFVMYALFLVGRLCVIATDDRLQRTAVSHFERGDERFYSTPH